LKKKSILKINPFNSNDCQSEKPVILFLEDLDKISRIMMKLRESVKSKYQYYKNAKNKRKKLVSIIKTLRISVKSKYKL